ncbi:MAG: tRNA-dihydrouridine synthase [Gammaproteobacteria bacterium]|nr:tRNA-dihydrouridine synthase [Gammaproteobacteria bacterium]MBU1601762.1 tRNA-dihydrouridine synthase [Gammaproteobacteria bacterium]MBU2432134.1 tRNA-dihydrouridine synthase [Gammaproteobacteria bacterium]MBU2450473.1 tRNA-dihydrouridine synthase [Gammaproteobacteria bacterium]
MVVCIVGLCGGYPAPTVSRHRHDAALFGEPEWLHEIICAVRAIAPAHIPFTAKMRLGIDNNQALVAEGLLTPERLAA